jgi:hypothetical protein
MEKIDQIFYINLDKRLDRKAEIENELHTKFNCTKAIRVPGICQDGVRGIYGCTMTHITLFRRMIEAGWNTMMVFEDDCEMLTSINEIEPYINSFLADEKLDILCIGNSCGINEPYNQLLNRCYNTQTTSCYIIKKQFVSTLLGVYFDDPDKALTMTPDNCPTWSSHLSYIDVGWFPLQKTHMFVMPNKRQVQQRASFSDITNKFEQYRL